ncbi:MAG: hypothetical protein HUK08_09370 [Bacteroidaceae bacterium]|nr:hypothetical protein [Bacteroidaceae bacterium]
MRKTIILLFAFIAIGVTSYASHPDEEVSKEAHYNKLAYLNRSFKMAGGTSITCFAQALSEYLPFDAKANPDPDGPDETIIDNANGYIHQYIDGSGDYTVDYAVWQCSDGKRLYIVSYYTTEPIYPGISRPKPGKCSETHFSGIINLTTDGEHQAVANTGYQAYLYNAQTKMLEPIEFPADRIKKPSPGVTPLYKLFLPRKGKNIEGRIGTNGEKQEIFRLVWNGKNGFVCQDYPEDRVEAYLYNNGTFTNVRTAPNGAVKVQLPHEGFNYSFILVDYNNGWWKIEAAAEAEGNEAVEAICDKAVGGYIHYSCVEVSCNHAEPVFYLRATPNDNGKVVWQTDEQVTLRPTGVTKDGKWWKLKTANSKYEGWAPVETICTNPLTSCS